MKSLKYHIGLLCSLFFLNSCDGFLDEEPLDFYTPSNSMTTIQHFQSSLNYLYNKSRAILIHGGGPDAAGTMFYATDFAFYNTPKDKLNEYKERMIPTFGPVAVNWRQNYDIIFNANVILTRLEAATEISEEDKNLVRAEALFFRAYAYRTLAHLYGGVPLILEEITTPRRDFTRASREEVYKQIKSDLETAISFLKNIEDVKDGKVNKQVAQHLLAEINISLGLYDEAIAISSAVINHPELGLMKERFGSRKTEEGDVYWDLFRLNNHNRTSGNKEGLWVAQNDYKNPASQTANLGRNWCINPSYKNIQITAKDASGKLVKSPAFVGASDGKCGPTAGWMCPSDHFIKDIWSKGSENDIRNSVHNLIRDVKIDNPESPAVGKWLVKDGFAKDIQRRQWCPLITKFVRIGNYPEELWKRDKEGNPILNIYGEHLLNNGTADGYKDVYFFRLAETYLLRAEAYILKGDKVKAAEDINALRSRAHADLATADEMDLDYLLDERLRELYGEEFRMITLCRMGKLADRNKKYNPYTGKNIEDYHNLWPIPFSEIERNTEVKWEQNPGY